MSDQNQNSREIHGVVAYYGDVDGIMNASRKIRDAGYKKWDAYTPFPVHGIDDAMGTKPTILPWIVLGMGLTGLFVGPGLPWYTNAFDSVFRIRGKPAWRLPANRPVPFQIIILCSAYTAFFGMLAPNKLPHLSNPLHKLERFKRITDDKFAICVEAKDPNFDMARVEKLLGEGSEHIETCPVDESRAGLPLWMHGVAAILTCASFIPLSLAFKGRFAPSEKPRYHVWPDMDFQRKAKTQTGWEGFGDGRAMRLPPEGTVAEGELRDDVELYGGVAQGSTMPEKVAHDQLSKDASLAWLTGFPAALEVDQAFLERGQERYGIYCSMCHGQQGDGIGTVALRAKSIDAARDGWIAPKALTSDVAKGYSNGELFHIASNGISTMKGYIAQVPAKDRWAIIAYVRALQATQGLHQSDAPRDAEYKPVPTIESVRSSDSSAGGL